MVDDFEKKMSIFKEMIVRVLDLKVNKESNNANYLIEINKMIELFSIGHALLKEKYKNN
jgi:acyl-ACP thioesterase